MIRAFLILFTLFYQLAFALPVNIEPIEGDIFLSHAWHLNKIGMNEQIEKNSFKLKKIRVAVIDSGIDINHPDLKRHLFTNKQEIPNNGIDDDGNGYIDDIHGVNFIDPNSIPQDDNGHGTHISGVIAADCNVNNGTCGILKNVEIIPLKFLNKNGLGDTNNAIKAIYYAISMKADVINASWGNPTYTPELYSAIVKARDAGIMIVVAAGNNSVNNDQYPLYPSSFDFDNVISVESISENDFLSTFSNYGARSVTVASPGENILSTFLNGTYKTLSGTSMATPIVTGIVGLYRQFYPNKSLKEIKAAVINGCEYKNNLLSFNSCNGVVNLNKTLFSN